MNQRNTVWVIFGTLLMGYVAGFSTPRASPEADGKTTEPANERRSRQRETGRSGAENDHSPTVRLSQDIRKLASQKLPPLVYQTLEVGDPILRQQLLSDLIARMDADNFRAMTDELSRVSLETGRAHDNEWKLIHMRAGQVAGAAAMETPHQNGRKNLNESAFSMQGWASADPAAAKQWIDQRTDLSLSERARLINALVKGSLVRNPEQAASILASLPEKDRLDNVKPFTGELIMNTGKEGAIAWIKSVNSAEPDSDFAKLVTDQVFEKLVWAGANQEKNATIVADLEQLSAVIPINADRVDQALNQLRRDNPVAGIELMDGILRSRTFGGLEFSSMAWGRVDEVISTHPAAVAKWLQNHPDSPLQRSVGDAFHSAATLPLEIPR